MGDYVSAKLFAMDDNTFLDDSTYTISREIITPTLHNNGKFVTTYSMELFYEPGTAMEPTSLATQGQAPLIGLEVSRDGGFRYGFQRLVPMGGIGSYRTRVKLYFE